MELEDKSISAEESLHLIEQYISRAKENLRNKSFDLLLWGTLVALAALANYVLMKFIQYEKPCLPWPILMIGGTIFSFIYHAVTAKRQQVVTYTDRFLMWLSISAAAVYFLIAFLCVRQHTSPLPFMFGHTSVLIFVTGAVLRSKPLINV